MPQFNYISLINFEEVLKAYRLVAQSTQINQANIEHNNSSIASAVLINSTFLQLYAILEQELYFECEHYSVKKNASISRFEKSLRASGYFINTNAWDNLLHISKIRNCLLHGNGRLDEDQYGLDTRNTIHILNTQANVTLINIINDPQRPEVATIKLSEYFLQFCFNAVECFINSQHQ